MAKVLIIDDEEAIRNSIRDILEFEDYEVMEAKDGFDALAKIKQNKLDVIISDIKMPKMDGMDLLDKVMDIAPDIPMIMISGHGSIDTAVEAVKKGAFDYLAKPLDLNRILITLRNALDRASLVEESKTLKKKIRKYKTQEIIGESDKITLVKNTIDKVALSEARVLVTGPNGTGKELVARWLHEKSNRADAALVEVNCAAIAPELIDSELFGHEKGAFTSAIKQHAGKFEQANGGTLFLDEIGDMSLAAQAKVLRALQENKITRVGGDKDINVDVRVIAATNKDLRKEIQAGRFREDLYHRLAVIVIHVPALNERREDIPNLVQHFLESIAAEQGKPVKSIEQDAVVALKEIDWTGNIRQLRNVVERLTILSDKTITKQDIDLYVSPAELHMSEHLHNIFAQCNNLEEVQSRIALEYNKWRE